MITWDSLKPMLCFLKSFGSDDEGGVPPCGGIPGICGRPPDCCATRERGSTQAMTVPPRRMYWSRTNSVLRSDPCRMDHKDHFDFLGIEIVWSISPLSFFIFGSECLDWHHAQIRHIIRTLKELVKEPALICLSARGSRLWAEIKPTTGVSRRLTSAMALISWYSSCVSWLGAKKGMTVFLSKELIEAPKRNLSSWVTGIC